MKKILALVLTLAMVLGLAACSINSDTYPNTNIKKFSVYCKEKKIYMTSTDMDFDTYFITGIDSNLKEETVKKLIENYCNDILQKQDYELPDNWSNNSYHCTKGNSAFDIEYFYNAHHYVYVYPYN